MRVRISYSVELEEVPAESSRVLSEAAEDLRQSLNIVEDISQDVERRRIDRETLLTALDECRKNITRIDAKLSDVSMIMHGYHEAKQQVLEEIAQSSTQRVEVIPEEGQDVD
jgi:hypothetical protein